MSKLRKKKRQPKRVLAVPDLEQSKAAVLNNLTSLKQPMIEELTCMRLLGMVEALKAQEQDPSAR
jgi:hypothetical protein